MTTRRPTPEQIAAAIAENRRLLGETEAPEWQPPDLEPEELDGTVFDDIEMPSWDEPLKQEKEESLDQLLQRWEREQYEKFHPKDGKAPPKGNGNGRWIGGFDLPPVENPEEAKAFDTIDASSWHGTDRPVRHFLDERRLFPFGYASSLSGAGAIGKTLIALQASVACVTGTHWLGAPIRKGPVLFYSAEEPIEEMHIRLDEICEAENMHLSVLRGLHIIDLNTVVDASLVEGNNKTGSVKLTKLYERLALTIERIKPVVVWLDNRGLLVTGNENDRTIASMAMRAFQLLAEKYQCSVIMLSHPSQAGLAKGTGSSGSTAWFNTGRSTVYMTKPTDEDGIVEDEDVRVLENNKANYSKTGTKVNVKWEFNRFVCTDPPPRADDGIGKPDKAKRIFMTLLREHIQMNMPVSAVQHSPCYAPTVFMSEPKKRLEGLSRRDLINAMRELIAAGQIENHNFGTKARPRWELQIMIG